MWRNEGIVFCPGAHFSERVTWDIQLLLHKYSAPASPILFFENDTFSLHSKPDFLHSEKDWRTLKYRFSLHIFPITFLLHLGSISLGSLSQLMVKLLNRWKSWNHMEHYFWPPSAGAPSLSNIWGSITMRKVYSESENCKDSPQISE